MARRPLPPAPARVDGRRMALCVEISRASSPLRSPRPPGGSNARWSASASSAKADFKPPVRSCNGFVWLSAAAALTSSGAGDRAFCCGIGIARGPLLLLLLLSLSPSPSPQSVRPRPAQGPPCGYATGLERASALPGSLLRSLVAGRMAVPSQLFAHPKSFVASSFLLNV
jgi:hypothetical protein